MAKIPHSLGPLERAVSRICAVENTLHPHLDRTALIMAAADHGIARSGGSISDQIVTWQMCTGFAKHQCVGPVLAGCENVDLYLYDCGVNTDVEGAINVKSHNGSEDFSISPAMTISDAKDMYQKGIEQAEKLISTGYDSFVLGEMGVGNTAVSSMLFHQFSGYSLAQCTGTGSSHSDEHRSRKLALLEECDSKYGKLSDPWEILSTFGGYEIIFLAGFIQGCDKRHVVVLLDGFISTAALLVARQFNNDISCCIAAHRSSEGPHGLLLDYLNLEPVISGGFCLGEGSGALFTLPILRNGIKVFENTSAFGDLGVTNCHFRQSLRFPVGTTSYIKWAGIIENVEYLKDKVSDIEVVLFEHNPDYEVLTKEEIECMVRAQEEYGISYTIHLPTDLEPLPIAQDKIDIVLGIVEKTKVLNVHSYVCHYHDEGLIQALLYKANIPPQMISLETLPEEPFNESFEMVKKYGLSVCLDEGHLILKNEYSTELLPYARVIHFHGVKDGKDHKSLNVYSREFLDKFIGEVNRYYHERDIVFTVEVFCEKHFLSSMEVL